MARKDDDFVLVNEKSNKGKYLGIIALCVVLAIGGYAYMNNSNTSSTPTTKPPVAADVAKEQAKTNVSEETAKSTATKAVAEPVKAVINFAYDSVKVSDVDNKKIQEFWSKVKNTKGELQVEGYADGKGTAEYNKRLSNSRAEQAVAELRKLGLNDQYKVSAQGVGMDKPIASNDSDDGRAKNRRVELTFTPAK